MVSLLSLSNELLVQIFSSSDTIQSAATLSEVNKTMNSLWVAHNNQILTNVLPTQIIGYKDAKDTAILEEIWTRKNTELASKTSGQPRVRAYLSTLLHNAKLATQAKKACMLWLHEQNELYDPLYSNLAKYHIAYYRMRKIVLLLEHPESQLQHVIDSAINCTPANTTFPISDAYTSFTLADLNMFLVTDERRYKAAQGITLSSKERLQPTMRIILTSKQRQRRRRSRSRCGMITLSWMEFPSQVIILT